MEAHRVLAGASLQPATLKVVTQAFDAAWQNIAPAFVGKPAAVATVRVALARALLSVVSEDSCDVTVLKNAALQVLDRDFRIHRGGLEVDA